MNKYILILNFLMFITKTYSTEVVVFGGGGDPDGDKTIFDGSLKNLAAKKDQLGFNIKASFDSGHKDTEKIISDELKVPNTPFVETNYEAIINDYVSKIKSGQIKSGEKLLILLNTHGGENTPPHTTHSIAMSGKRMDNMSMVRGDASSSVDKLFKLSEIAKTYHIKLAIMDFSCHSGNSLALANENTCIITSSGPNHFGYTSFAEDFYKKMEKGKSLEEVFLNTKAEAYAPSFPMISTKIGIQLKNEEYDLFSPYLNSVDDTGNADKLSPYLKNVLTENNLCKRESDFAKLIKQMESFQSVAGQMKSHYRGEENLVDALIAYKKQQDEYIKTLIDLGQPLLGTQEKIVYGKPKKGKDGKLTPTAETISWAEILGSYPISNKSYFENSLKTEKSPTQRLDYENTISKYEKIDEKRQEILKKYPVIKNVPELYTNLKNSSAELWNKVSKVSELANRYYESRYRELQKTESNHAEPCKDFIL